MEDRMLDLLTNNNLDKVLLINTITNKKLIMRYKSNKTSLAAVKRYMCDVLKYKINTNNNIRFKYKNKILDNDEIPLEELGLVNKLNIIKLVEHNIDSELYEKYLKLYENTDKSNILCQIYVKTLTGKTITIDIYENMIGYFLKFEIQNKIGIPPAQQRLIFKGDQIADNEKLADIFKSEDSVHLVSRLLGGMYHETSGRNGTYEELTDLIIDLEPDL